MCWPLFHKWAKWSNYVVNKHGEAVQDLSCTVCGKSQIRHF